MYNTYTTTTSVIVSETGGIVVDSGSYRHFVYRIVGLRGVKYSLFRSSVGKNDCNSGHTVSKMRTFLSTKVQYIPNEAK